MQSEIPDQASDDARTAKSEAALRRAEMYRERFRRSQAIAAQKARSGAAGAAPSEGEAARMVAEFIAKGGQVTVCPPAEDAPADPAKERGGKPG